MFLFIDHAKFLKKFIFRSSGPYLCGHLHTLGGMVPEMYTLQSNGALELELADWKENRK